MNVSQQNGKRGILVLVTGSVLQLFLGIIYVWSVFVMPVSEQFTWAVDSAKLTSSFMLCCFVLGILIGGKAQVKIGTSRVVLIGGLLMAAGMLATSFVSAGAPWLIYITYGIAGGFGVGMGYNAIITSAQKWFPTKRGLATGISVCAFGFSTVIFAPLVEALIGRFGVAATFRILAAAFAVVVLLLFHFIQLPQTAAGGAAQNQAALQKQYTTSEILRTRAFYYLTLSLMLGTAAYFILNPSFKTMALTRGLSAGMSTAVVMVAGIGNAIGRLAVPVLSDKIGREVATIGILVLTMLCAFLLTFVSGFLFMIVVAVIALCYGGYSGVYPLLTGDRFGMQNIGSNYGAVMVGFACSALFFPMLIGIIQSELTKFIVLGVLAGVGAVLVFLLKAEKAAK